MKSKIRSRVLNNFWLKLVAVILAFLLWLVVINVSDSVITVKIKGIPVQQLNGSVLENLDKVYDVAKGDTVDIVVKGRRTIVEGLGVDDFIATADLSTMSITNTVQITVTPKSAGIRDEITVTCEDNVMRLNLEEKISLQYSVKVKTFGAVKNGYAVCGYQTSPNIITVEGPKSAVEKVTEVVVNVDVSHKEAPMDIEGDVVLYDAYGDEITNDKISVSQKTVKVHLDVHPTKEVPVNVDIKGLPKEGFTIVEVLYQPQTVLVAGELEKLDSVEEIVVDDVSISGMDTDLETTVSLKEYIPDDIFLANPSEDVVITVDLEELFSKELVVKASDVELLQKTTDRMYSLELSDDFCIVVTGLEAEVSGMTVDKFSPKIYCKDLSIGIHSNADIQLTDVEGITYKIQGTATLTITSK